MKVPSSSKVYIYIYIYISVFSRCWHLCIALGTSFVRRVYGVVSDGVSALSQAHVAGCCTLCAFLRANGAMDAIEEGFGPGAYVCIVGVVYVMYLYFVHASCQCTAS